MGLCQGAREEKVEPHRGLLPYPSVRPAGAHTCYLREGKETLIAEELEVSRPGICRELAVQPWESPLTPLGLHLTASRMDVTDLFIHLSNVY